MLYFDDRGQDTSHNVCNHATLIHHAADFSVLLPLSLEGCVVGHELRTKDEALTYFFHSVYAETKIQKNQQLHNSCSLQFTIKIYAK